jgi:hypothetical protein
MTKQISQNQLRLNPLISVSLFWTKPPSLNLHIGCQYSSARFRASGAPDLNHDSLCEPSISANSHMQFADIYHYVGRSDSLGIIPCRRIKVGLVKSWRRPIPCRSAQDHCCDLRSHAGRAFKPFVQQRPLDSGRHCPFSPIR